MPEPIYVDDGEEPFFDKSREPPKWATPETSFQKMVLSMFERKWFKKGEKGRIILIEKAMVPLAIFHGKITKYPLEWVNMTIKWARQERAKGHMVQMEGWLSFVNNESRKQEWCEKALQNLTEFRENRFNEIKPREKGDYGARNTKAKRSDPSD